MSHFIIPLLTVKPESRSSVVRGLEKMKERELLELLCQYESEEMVGSAPQSGSRWPMVSSQQNKIVCMHAWFKLFNDIYCYILYTVCSAESYQ